MLLKLEEIKAQCGVEPDMTDADALLEFYGSAVQARTETYLNRKLYAPKAAIPADDPTGMHLTDDIKLAMLLLVSYYTENRSTVSEVQKIELPMSFKWNVQPYRIIPL